MAFHAERVAKIIERELSTILLMEAKNNLLKYVSITKVVATKDLKAKMLDKEYVADGAVVIDVGINVDENGKLCGDVKWEGLDEAASAATPVPGGVGAVTTAVLCKHLAQAALRRRS